jgi:uncharacterized integral membrane protein (TIGR00697 family)
MFKINKFDLLVAVYVFCIIASELMGGKTFYLFNIGSFKLNASVAIFLLPLVFTINDVITEVFGKERARSVVRSGLVTVVMLILFSFLATALGPSTRFAGTEKAYDTIFHLTIRFSIASLIAFALAEFTDIFIFSKIRSALGKKNLWLRNNVSNFISQLIDTTVFMVLAFWSFDKGLGANWSFLFSLILPYWLLKCSMSVLETPFVYLGTAWFKKDKKELELSASSSN